MKLAKGMFALIVLVASGLRADVTIRYQSEFKPSAALQPIMEQFMKTMQTATNSSVIVQGNRAYTTTGNWTQIFDFAKGEMTLVDPAHKTFTTLPVAQFADKMAGAMPQMSSQQMQGIGQALASIKSNVDSKVTGKTAEIQGVQAEEREVTLTMDFPLPPGMTQNGPAMKMVIHIWTAKNEEAMRVPAIRELTGYQAWQRYIMNPAGVFEKVAGKMPGVSEIIGPLLTEMFKNQAVILRTHMEIYTPILATLAKQMAAQGKQFPIAVDPDAPLMEINQEVAELSSAPVDITSFEIPKEYTSVPPEDMIRAMVKAQSAATAVAAPPAADAPK
ncbi:MAG: hypothetical protein ABSC93_02690 [Bryobacteraceae bacterium]|jgi:hypothetical protein